MNPTAVQLATFVELLAPNLGQLPGPEDGVPLMFLERIANFPGHPEEWQKDIAAMNQAIAAGIFTFLANNGISMVNTAELQTAPQIAGQTVVTLHCKMCGEPLAQVTAGRDGKAAIAPHTLNLNCGTRHGTT